MLNLMWKSNFYLTNNKIVNIIYNLIETYHLSLRKGCGDMKIQD